MSNFNEFDILRPQASVRHAGAEIVVESALRDLRRRVSGPIPGIPTAEDLHEIAYRREQIDVLRPYLTTMSDWEMGFLMKLITMRDETPDSQIQGERLLHLSPEQLADIESMTITYAIVTSPIELVEPVDRFASPST